MKISVVIPVYKNKQLFLENMAHNEKHLKGCEIIIVDDASGENLKQDLERSLPDIKVVVNNTNLGFSKTVNRGVAEATGDLLLLLNTDVRLLDDSYRKATEQFNSDDRLFAITFKQKEKDGEYVGKNRIYFERGFVRHSKADNVDTGLNSWAEGGSSLFRKSYFDALNGFDELYSPFYWEDIDLSYRAYKRGWSVIFDENVVVEHKHESTVGKYFDKGKIMRVAYRNQFIFMWKNIGDGSLFMNHLLHLPFFLLSSILRRDWPVLQGFVSALIRLPRIREKRKIENIEALLSDQEILAQF